MAVYPESIQFEFYQITDPSTAPSWIDFTQDVVESQKVSYGIFGDKPTDRIASTGSLDFTLKNDASAVGGDNLSLIHI